MVADERSTYIRIRGRIVIGEVRKDSHNELQGMHQDM